MGRSKRRMKRNAPKVRVGVVKRCKNVKSDVPLEVHANCSALQRKLQEQPGWDAHATTVSNYKQTRFAHSSNKHVAALSTDAPGAGPDPDKDDSERVSAKADPDLQRALGHPGPQGPALPEPLTTRQRAVVRALVDKHDSDIQAMVKDTKLNSALLSGHKLKRMVAAYHWHGADSSVQFQQPKKGLT